RIGVVNSTGGPTRWLGIPGDQRNNYLARMEWAENSDALIVPRLNRLQNTIELLLATAATGQIRPVLTERDSAWVEVVDDLYWSDQGRRFTWVSERDGWTHVYDIPRDGEAWR